MTRTAQILALVLGGALLFAGFSLQPGVAWARVLPGGVLVGLGLLMPRLGAAHLVVLLVSLVSLAMALPQYFRAPRVWPELVIIALSSLVFALGLLGYLLDRFRGPDQG
jgi:hypothetical protein